MKTRVLVTGAGGQFGKTIEELYKVNQKELDLVFVSKTKLDITKKEDLKTFFKVHSFQYCINCAAYTNVEQAEKTPEIAFKVNAEGVKYLAETCKEFNTVLIHISTDYVFDGETTTPYVVNDITNPINEYGKSKLLGEKYIQDAMSSCFIVRTSWLYSKKYGKNFYKKIINLTGTHERLSITTDETGCPTNTESLAKYVLDFVINNSRNYGIKHFSDKKMMTWFDFAEDILSENNLNHKTVLVKTSKYVTFARRPKYSVLKNSKE